MADKILSMNGVFPEKTVKEIFYKANGKSSIAKLANQTPIAFTGNRVMVFTSDDEVNLVGENEAKSLAGASVTPVSIVPVKVEHTFRVSHEFMYASEEDQVDYFTAISDTFASKIARGLDLMAMHGLNPRTGEVSSLLGTNYIDAATTTITTTAGSEDSDVESAIATFDSYDTFDVNGIAMSKSFRTSLSKLTTATGIKLFPELTWGADAASLNGLPIDVNSTVNYGDSTDLAIIGDWNYFKWGFAKEIPFEIIEYGDPDGNGDLKRYNQIAIRAEAWLGWGILDTNAFVRIVSA